jgi:hypothetical protein
MPDDFHDARDVLQALGIDWRTDVLLMGLHRLARKSLFAVKQVMGIFALADTRNATLQSATETWIELLLQTAVETVLFPDPLPADAKTWEALAQIWDEYILRVREFHLRGVRVFSEGDAWSIRGTVRAAWNIEFAHDGHPVEIGPVVADSYHRTALRSAPDLWQAYSGYVGQATDNPANRPALWDAFTGRWKPENVGRDCESVGANLSSELRRIRERLHFLPQPPTTSATATAVANASIGNVVIHNHISMPGATPPAQGAKQQDAPAEPSRGQNTAPLPVKEPPEEPKNPLGFPKSLAPKTTATDHETENILSGGGEGEAQGEGKRFVTKEIGLSQAERISSINRGTIQRAARRGEIINNGKEGRAFRLDSADFNRWVLNRSSYAKDGKPETDEHVEKLFAKNKGK